MDIFPSFSFKKKEQQKIKMTLHPKAVKYIFFSRAHGTCSRIDHMLGHKTILNIFKKIEIISSIFSDQYKTRNQLQEKKCKTTNMWRLNNMQLNNQWVTEEVKEEIKKHL